MCTLVRNVEKIYASDDKLKREDVQILQEWLKKQPHLPQLSEFDVILFLHSCYYSIEATKTTIDIYFTKKTQQSYMFAHLNEEELRSICSVQSITVLPSKTSQGYRIIVLKLIDSKTEHYNFARIIRLQAMILCLFSFESGPANGFIGILDAKDFTLAHLMKFNLFIAMHSLDLLQEGAPIRIKGVHIINAMPIVDKAINMLKPFIKNHLFEMIKIHSSLESLYDEVPSECLPSDYNGKLPSVQDLHEKNVKHLLENEEFFEWYDTLKVDETKRLEKSNLFGTVGTFKKLAID